MRLISNKKTMKNKSNTIKLGAILIFTIIISATSCISQKKVAKICATCPTETTHTIDSVVINSVDTIYKTSKLDSLIFISTIDLTKKVDTVYFEDETWKAQLFVTNHKLKAHIEHLSDSISTIVQTKETTVKDVETKTYPVNVPVITPKYNKWYYFLLIFFISNVIFWIGWIVWKIKTRKFNINFK